MSNGLAAYYESLDYAKCTQEDLFQAWMEKNESDLEEQFLAQVDGLLDDEYADYVSDNYERFTEWAKEQWEAQK